MFNRFGWSSSFDRNSAFYLNRWMLFVELLHFRLNSTYTIDGFLWHWSCRCSSSRCIQTVFILNIPILLLAATLDFNDDFLVVFEILKIINKLPSSVTQKGQCNRGEVKDFLLSNRDLHFVASVLQYFCRWPCSTAREHLPLLLEVNFEIDVFGTTSGCLCHRCPYRHPT